MDRNRGMKVGEVAALVGVSVRTLHHYDRIGLLHPQAASPAGYRLYLESDLERLQQILFFRELDVGLDETAAILNQPGFDRRQALERHRELLAMRIARLGRLVDTVDRTLRQMGGEGSMKDKEMFRAFSLEEIEAHEKKHAREAEARYGGSEAWKVSRKRYAGYTGEEKTRIMEQGDRIFRTIAGLMEEPEGSDAVQAAISEWRDHIDRSFYPCPTDLFRGLAELYVSDERFEATFEAIRPGLAAYMSRAMGIWCDRADAS